MPKENFGRRSDWIPNYATAHLMHCTNSRPPIANRSSIRRKFLNVAYALRGDAAKASAAYQDFLRLWKDTDPDIPVLKQAKAEYAKPQ